MLEGRTGFRGKGKNGAKGMNGKREGEREKGSGARTSRRPPSKPRDDSTL